MHNLHTLKLLKLYLQNVIYIIYSADFIRMFYLYTTWWAVITNWSFWSFLILRIVHFNDHSKELLTLQCKCQQDEQHELGQRQRFSVVHPQG